MRDCCRKKTSKFIDKKNPAVAGSFRVPNKSSPPSLIYKLLPIEGSTRGTCQGLQTSVIISKHIV